MVIRLPSRKTTAIAIAALILFYLLFGWLALPPLLQSQAEKFIAEKTGHRLTLDEPEFNPFTLALRLHNLRLTEPDGKPLMGFKDLLVDVSVTSLFRWAYVFDAIRLDDLEATIVKLPDGRLNWSPLVDALGGRNKGVPPAQAQAHGKLPRLQVRKLTLSGGEVDIVDHRRQPGFTTRIKPLDVELNDLSTLPDNKGLYQISAHTGFGAAIHWRGEVTLNPLAVAGSFTIDGVSLAKLAPLLALPTNLGTPDGTAAFAANYRVAQAQDAVDLTLDRIVAKVSGLKIRTAGSDEPVLTFDAIEAKDGHFDLRRRSLALGSVTLTGGGADLRRSADGRLNVLDLVPPKSGVKPAKPAAPPWHYRIDRLALSGFRADFRDQTLSPPAQLGIADIAADVTGVSDDLKVPLPVRLSFRAPAGGSFEAEGKVVAAEPSADFRIKLSDLALKPAQPYLGAVTTLTLADGKLSVDGNAGYDAKGAVFKGAMALRNLRLTVGAAPFLAWKSLASHNVRLTPVRLAIRDLNLNGLDSRLIIDQDKSVNVTKILRRPSAQAKAAPGRRAPAFFVNIDRLHVVHGQMDYADYSLALPFGTLIHDLHGSINGLSSRPGASGQLQLDGQVDEYGSARATGRIDLFDPAGFTDVKLVFRNVEMTRLTPYSATFAGRKIDSGKLSLDLEYKIKDRQLSGDNQIVMDSLKLGERVESPKAKDLPLDLAVALLQDADGRIDLGLPVSGNLDDPQFSFGHIVWKAIANVLTKIVSAPFRALGALFGGGEKLKQIAFEAGRVQLAPPEREKLVKLAGALDKRPKLALSIHGTYADADHLALQDRQLRRAIAAEMGEPVDDRTDPGPLSTTQPEVRSALEGLFSERLGGGELAALKDGFRKANPGQLPESAADKMLSKLSGLFHEKRKLSEDEIAQLKGADFCQVLFDRLRAKETVTDERLKALAKERGEAALDTMRASGAPLERIALAAPEKVDVENDSVPLKMELKVAQAPAVPATPAATTQPAASAPAAK